MQANPKLCAEAGIVLAVSESVSHDHASKVLEKISSLIEGRETLSSFCLRENIGELAQLASRAKRPEIAAAYRQAQRELSVELAERKVLGKVRIRREAERKLAEGPFGAAFRKAGMTIHFSH